MEAVSRRNAWAEELRSIANAGSQTVGLRRQTVSSHDRSPCPLVVHVRLGLGSPWQSRKVIRRPATQYSKITLKRVVTIHQADHLAKKRMKNPIARPDRSRERHRCDGIFGSDVPVVANSTAIRGLEVIQSADS